MKLEDFRKQIDDIDSQLFSLLRDRLKIVEQVGELKKSTASEQYIIRPGREALKVKQAFQMAKQAGLDDKISQALASLWRDIISLSIQLESPAKIGYNHTKSKNTYWVVREYFGPYSETAQFKLDKEIIKSITTKKINVGAFIVEPNEGFEPWWVELTKHSNLSVFASAPIFSSKRYESKYPILLVSNVTPEPTGEDKFVYVISKPLPDDEKDNFEVISQHKNYSLVISDEFYSNYTDKLGAKYIGCFATFDF